MGHRLCGIYHQRHCRRHLLRLRYDVDDGTVCTFGLESVHGGLLSIFARRTLRQPQIHATKTDTRTHTRTHTHYAEENTLFFMQGPRGGPRFFSFDVNNVF